MRALSLLLFTLLAGPALAQVSQVPTGCKEDNSDCREDCTIEYGSSTRTYDKLGACMQKCTQKYDKCRERSITHKERQKLDMDAPSSSPQVPAEKGQRTSTDAPGGKPASTSADEPDEPAAPPVRRGVFRASEPEPTPEPAPKPTPEPAKVEEPKKPEPAATPQAATAEEPKKPEPEAAATSEELEQLINVYDDPPPRPKSKPKSTSPRPKPPPEPKKDISEWDPNEK